MGRLTTKHTNKAFMGREGGEQSVFSSAAVYEDKNQIQVRILNVIFNIKYT